MLPLPSALKLGIAFLCAVSCASTSPDLFLPISGTQTNGTQTNDVATEFSIDYEAEWRIFLHEHLIIHEQKPEHPFWSAASTTTSLPPSLPTVANGSESAISAETKLELELQEIVDAAYEPVVAEYEFYSRGSDIMELQQFLNVDMVDGIYGPQTRAAHIEFLGGPEAAVKLWYAPTWDKGIYVNGELPTLNDLVEIFFFPEDRTWALRVAHCESSGQPADTTSTAVHPSSGASGWFQHLPKFWETGDREGRVWDAEFGGNSILDPVANVGTAAYLFYKDGDRHWNPSKSCWGGTPHG